MPEGLKKNFAGLPRWAWVAILAGGLTIGLVLRYRSQQAAANATDTSGTDQADLATSPDIGCGPDGLDANGYPCGDSYQPSNAVDSLGTGGYVNYPIQPLQPGITVQTNAGGVIPCNEKDRPKQKPRKGFQWTCGRGGVWIMTPLTRGRPGHGSHNGHHCPPGFHWRNGKCRKKHQHAGGRNGGGHQGGRHKMAVA